MAELIVSCINVFLIFFAVGYFLSGMITAKLNQRKAKIAGRIESARSHKEEAVLSRDEYERRIRTFETEREAILAKARERAGMTEAHIIKEAQSEAERIVERANREAVLQKAKLKDEIKMDIIHVSEKLAEKLIIEGSDTARQEAWIDSVLEQMGDGTWESL